MPEAVISYEQCSNCGGPGVDPHSDHRRHLPCAKCSGVGKVRMECSVKTDSEPTICVKCKHVIKRGYGPLGYFCKLTEQQGKINAITGERSPSIYVRCGILNHGNCPKYEAKA